MAKDKKNEKVNIIAHSKGGLDARYMISKLNMGEYVASLTMISSPHRRCKFVYIACKIPDNIDKFIAKFFNKYYRFNGSISFGSFNIWRGKEIEISAHSSR